MTRSGNLDRRITIMAPGSHEDSEYGPQPGEPVVFAARVPAQRLDLLPRRPSDDSTGVLRKGEKSSQLRMRFVAGVTSDMYVVMHDENDQKYQIASQPAEVGRREYLEFLIKAYST